MEYRMASLNTKRAFAQALKQAVRKKPLSKITVSELVEACHVNRKTFYYHFEDIYALLVWTLEAEAMEVVRQFKLPIELERSIRFVMDYVEENDYIICCAYDAVGREGMKRFFYADFIEVLSAAIEGSNDTLQPEFRAFAVEFYAEAISSVLLNWAKDHERRDKEQTIQHLCVIMFSALQQLESRKADN